MNSYLVHFLPFFVVAEVLVGRVIQPEALLGAAPGTSMTSHCALPVIYTDAQEAQIQLDSQVIHFVPQAFKLLVTTIIVFLQLCKHQHLVLVNYDAFTFPLETDILPVETHAFLVVPLGITLAVLKKVLARLPKLGQLELPADALGEQIVKLLRGQYIVILNTAILKNVLENDMERQSFLREVDVQRKSLQLFIATVHSVRRIIGSEQSRQMQSDHLLFLFDVGVADGVVYVVPC